MKHKNYENNNNKNNNNLEIDMKELELLQQQFIGCIFILLSDIIAFSSLSQIIILRENNENNINEYLVLIIQAEIFAVISRVIFLNVDFTRYADLYERYENGEINFSLEPNIVINIADIYNLINYVYAYLGAIGIYNLNQVISLSNIELLELQVESVFIHLLSDFFLIESTLESIQLVKNRYEVEKIPIQNPDLAAIDFAILNHISKILYVNFVFKSYEITAQNLVERGLEELLIGNKYMIISGVSSIVASYYILIAVCEIYNRHIVEPVFAV